MADERRIGEIVERVRVDHERLDALFSDLRDALAEGEGAAAVAGLFDALRSALEVHLAQEGRIYYPGLSGLRPDHRRLLDTFVAAHDEFRTELAAIAEALAAAPAGEIELRIDAMARRFVMHESGEELLLQRIDAEVHGAAAPR